MKIRFASRHDLEAIERLYLLTFAAEERESVAKLATDLVTLNTTPETLSLVVETDGAIVGHVAFSPVKIEKNPGFQGYILAPLGVTPDFQKRGIGTKLVDYGMQHLAATGVNAVFVYGDPEYYCRFGFSAEAARQYNAPYPLKYPQGWQANVREGAGIENPLQEITCVAALCDPTLW